MLLQGQPIGVVELAAQFLFRQLLDGVVDLGQFLMLLVDPLRLGNDHLLERLGVVDRHNGLKKCRLAKRINHFLRIGVGKLQVGIVADVGRVNGQGKRLEVAGRFVGCVPQSVRLQRQR